MNWDPAALPAKPEVDPASFFDLDLRVGVIRDVVAFPEARAPAWKLQVDFGEHVGTHWSSAQVTNYTREELLGRKVIAVVNLPAKRIAGFKSEFLVLGGMGADSTVHLLQADADLPPGTAIA